MERPANYSSVGATSSVILRREVAMSLRCYVAVLPCCYVDRQRRPFNYLGNVRHVSGYLAVLCSEACARGGQPFFAQ